MTSSFVNDAYWKRRVPNEPLDLIKVIPWNGPGPWWCSCEICHTKLSTGYEMILEWGDTEMYENTGFLCAKCMMGITNRTRNASGLSEDQVVKRRNL